MDTGRQDQTENASAFIVAIEDYEHHQKLDDLSASVSDLAKVLARGAPVVVSGGYDNTIRRWDARTGEPIGEPLKGHTGWVSAVALGAIDGAPIIVSGGQDNTIRCWDVHAGESDRCLVVMIGEPVRTIDMDDNVGVVVGLDRGVVLLELLTMRQK